jgi:hypothetical protein
MEATFLKTTCVPLVPNFPRGDEDKISALAPSMYPKYIAHPFLESENIIPVVGVKIL